MAPRQTQARSRIALAASITLLLTATVFVGLVNANLAGTNVLVADLAMIITIICFPASVIAWVLVFQLGRLLLSLITLGGSWALCYVSSGLFFLAMDAFMGVRKAPSINTDVLQFATFGAVATVFFVLAIASLISTLCHLC